MCSTGVCCRASPRNSIPMRGSHSSIAPPGCAICVPLGFFPQERVSAGAQNRSLAQKTPESLPDASPLTAIYRRVDDSSGLKCGDRPPGSEATTLTITRPEEFVAKCAAPTAVPQGNMRCCWNTKLKVLASTSISVHSKASARSKRVQMMTHGSQSEYQTIFIVYSSKRPQIMYKSVEKQIT